MRYRKLSATGDYVFGNGQRDFYINSPEAIAQNVATYLKLWLGEWYLDVSAGTPWLQGVFGYHTKEESDSTLQGVILGLTGVVDLTNWESTRDPVTREYISISAKLDTIYGQTQLQMQNVGNS